MQAAVITNDAINELDPRVVGVSAGDGLGLPGEETSVDVDPVVVGSVVDKPVVVEVEAVELSVDESVVVVSSSPVNHAPMAFKLSPIHAIFSSTLEVNSRTSDSNKKFAVLAKLKIAFRLVE